MGLSAALLSGCGSDSNSNSGTLTIPIQGLDYETTTFSGTTDADGRFFYRSGEIIHFSIADLTIASVASRKQINVEHWLGMALPSNAVELESVLDNSDRYSEFHSQFNALLLLASLDDDQDFSNGINLSQWQDNLNSLSINTHLSITEFAREELPILLDELNVDSLDLGSYASELFAFVGVSFSHYKVSERRRDSDLDGEADYSYAYEYNDQGLRTLYSSTDETTGCTLNEYQYEFDANGNTTLDVQIRRSWNSEELTCNQTRRVTNLYEFNEAGQITLRNYFYDGDGNGSTDESRTETYSYDGDGNILEAQTVKDTNGNGEANSIATTSYSYANQGLEVDILFTEDSNGDGTIDATRTTTQYFDANELYLGEEYVRDTDNDPETANEVGSYVYRYSEDGLLLGWSYEKETNGDDIIDARVSNEFIYDASGRQTHQNYEYDNDGDNDVSTAMTSGHKSSTIYNEDGRQIAYSYYYYSNGEKTAGRRSERTYEYDEQGNRTSWVRKEAQNITGDWSRIYYYYSEFDAAGNEISELTHQDNDGDGTLDYAEREQYGQYTDFGEYGYYLYQELDPDSETGGLTVVTYQEEETYTFDTLTGEIIREHYREDDDGDDIFESETINDYDYVSLGDGVEYWFNDYLD